MFGWVDRRCKQATGFYDNVFSGKSLILTGDHGQLPPVADKLFYHSKPSSVIGGQGHQAYRMVDKVIKLTVNQRVQGMTSDQVLFRDLLLRLRKGESTLDNWALLLTRQPSHVGNLSKFEDATRLFYSNEQVAKYNHEQLLKLQNPVAHINAHHSSAVAKEKPYFSEEQPMCVPICPITVSSQTEGGFHERQQLPLRLAWALTIHKSQGRTLSKAWIDIGKTERTAEFLILLSVELEPLYPVSLNQ